MSTQIALTSTLASLAFAFGKGGFNVTFVKDGTPHKVDRRWPFVVNGKDVAVVSYHGSAHVLYTDGANIYADISKPSSKTMEDAKAEGIVRAAKNADFPKPQGPKVATLGDENDVLTGGTITPKATKAASKPVVMSPEKLAAFTTMISANPKMSPTKKANAIAKAASKVATYSAGVVETPKAEPSEFERRMSKLENMMAQLMDVVTAPRA